MIGINVKYETSVRVFKGLGDPNRWMILELLQSGELCACEILDVLKISQPTLSHHIKILCDSGFVSYRRQGKWVYYSLNKEGCDHAQNLLKEITTLKPNNDNERNLRYDCSG